MSLSAGDKLGPYEVLSPIGAGGMGEVWKARDTRLDRTVAIKTSKVEFNERFEREARAVAALNHPHICQFYDVGPNYLVMEFIDGKPRAFAFGARTGEQAYLLHRIGQAAQLDIFSDELERLGERRILRYLSPSARRDGNRWWRRGRELRCCRILGESRRRTRDGNCEGPAAPFEFIVHSDLISIERYRAPQRLSGFFRILYKVLRSLRGIVSAPEPWQRFRQRRISGRLIVRVDAVREPVIVTLELQ